MSHLNDLSRDQLEAAVFAKFFSDNPQLKRGSNIGSPVGLAKDGVVIEANTTTDIDNYDTVTCSSFKVIPNEDGTLPDMKVARSGWAYPWKAMRLKDEPELYHPADLAAVEVGDTLMEFVSADDFTERKARVATAEDVRRRNIRLATITIRMGFVVEDNGFSF